MQKYEQVMHFYFSCSALLHGARYSKEEEDVERDEKVKMATAVSDSPARL